MRRPPLIPTLLVASACALMVALGIWQLRRAAEKEALIALYEANRAMSSEIAFPAMPPVPETALFRASQAFCLAPVGWRVAAGRAASGESGFRYIAECQTGAEGPGLLADMGVARKPDLKPAWHGGMVAGIVTLEPDSRSLISRLAGKSPPLRPMLVARAPAPGLKPSAPPTTRDVPNNHLAYAVQWFLFAGVAAIIYALALRRRWQA